MTSSDIQHIYKKINHFIENRQLKNAFDEIKKLNSEQHIWSITDRLAELETNYQYMLHYLTETPEDPNQPNIYHQLMRQTYDLAQEAVEALHLKNSSAFFFEKRRFANVREPISLNDYRETIIKQMDTFSILELMEEGQDKTSRMRINQQAHEHTIQDLFYTIFVSPRAKEEDILLFREFIHDSVVPIADKCMLISALTINILQRFDTKKIEFLLETTLFPDAEIGIRAMMGLLPILQHYHSRWKLYPECDNRLKVVSDNPLFVKRCIIGIIQYIQARDTEKISKKLTEEILPEMMKLSPIIGKKINLDEWMGESGLDEKNPEWQKILDDAGLTNKMQEFSDLQLEGADVFHSTFSNLKTYPFFYEMSNWFLPFDAQHSQIQNISSESSLFKTLEASPYICNSDKYSLCLSLMMMPESYRSMMVSQLNAESDEIQKMMTEESVLNPDVQEEKTGKQYVQDLYRFFKLFVRKHDFLDIFSLPLNFHTIEPLQVIVENEKYLQRIALYYFEKNHFEEALSAYQQLSQLPQSGGETWQKIGYCHQMLGNISEALSAYLHADLIDENKPWVLRRIAQCYRMLNQPEKALEQYHRLEQLKPDDKNVQLNIGHCYLAMKDFDSALNYYFKVELSDSSNAKAWRSIAWCAFLSRKFDISKSYYAQIIAHSANANDYLNAAHVELCLGNTKQAFEFYKKSQELIGDFDAFEHLLFEDKDELQGAGVDTKILPLLLDKIRYIG